MPRHALARRIHDALLLLLPGWLRERVGEELRETFAARLAEAPTVRARLREFLVEAAGVLHTAVSSRTAPGRVPVRLPRTDRPRMLLSLRQDLVYAGRTIRRGPAVAALAVLTLALGVGASTAMFTILDDVLLRPLPFPEPERIVMVHPTLEDFRDVPSMQSVWERGRFSPYELAQWLEVQRAFEHAAGYRVDLSRIPVNDVTEHVPVGLATADFFPLLGVKPLLGRLPEAKEPEPVVVLTHAFWRARHGADPAIVGRTILINEKPVRVIGVLAAGFELPGIEAEMWRPLAVASNVETISNHFLRAIGRLRDGVSVSRAEQETARILGGIVAEHPGHTRHDARVVVPVAEATKQVRTPLLILASASVLLLVIACANVALLLLGAGADRVRELAVRGALGARKRRIGMQLLVESLVLSTGGAILGLAVALLVMKLLIGIAPEGIPRLASVAIDLRTFGLVALLAVTTGVVVGCFPAFSLTRIDAVSALRAGATAPGGGRLQRAIVVAELALATVLLVGAGLLTRTMLELQRVQPGFAVDGVFTLQLALPWDRFFGPGADREQGAARLAQLAGRLEQAVRAVPGVGDVAVTSDMPYSDDRGTNSVEPEGYTPAEGEEIDVARRFVSGEYFAVLRIPALQGRLLDAADDRPDAEPVMVVTDAFARRFWPDGRWLDRKVGFWDTSYRVVGVIADTREHDLRGDEDAFKFYVPDGSAGNAVDNFLIRSTLPAGTLLPALRGAVAAVDPGVVILDALPMRERLAGSVAEYRYRMRLMVAFSLMAALFALLGVYGVMSRAVARRRQELGIRVALGAQQRGIVSLVLGDAALLGAIGGGLGIVGAALASRVIESMIWGVPRTDAVTFVGTAALLLLLAVAAALLPARRAAGVEPMSVMRG